MNVCYSRMQIGKFIPCVRVLVVSRTFKSAAHVGSLLMVYHVSTLFSIRLFSLGSCGGAGGGGSTSLETFTGGRVGTL